MLDEIKSPEEETLHLENLLGDYIEKLDIEEDKINEQMAAQPSWFVYYARIAAIIKRRAKRKRLELKRYEAFQAKAIREEAGDARKVTVQFLEENIQTSLEWKRLSEELIDLEAGAELADSVKEGFYQRKGLLEEVARSVRKEFDTDVFLKKKVDEFKARKQFDKEKKN
jgi:hypothetical protein